MQCKQCGTNLVRGFSFCLECGLPVPDEMLEESGLPQRNIDSGPQEAPGGEPRERASSAAAADQNAEDGKPGDLKPQLQGGGEQDRGAALKPQLVGGDAGIGGRDLKPQLMGLGEENSGRDLKPKYVGGGEDDDKGAGEQVKVVLHEMSSEDDTVTEKLVFCPNCGMRMQHNPNICDVCGMLLGNKPSNVPTTTSGVPLFNTDGDAFANGFGGFGGLGGGLADISDEDASRIDSFVNGNNDPMFNQSSPADDLAALTQQLQGFSAAAEMRSIAVTENTRIRQIEPEDGMEREVSDFSMTDDLSSESIPMSDDGMPVVGDYSMDENPNEFFDLDPYSFINTSMDELALEPPPKKAPSTIPKAAPAPERINPVPPVAARSPEPIKPVITEPVPVISEPAPPAPNTVSNNISNSQKIPAFGGLGAKVPAAPPPAPPAAPPPVQAEAAAAPQDPPQVQPVQPTPQAQPARPAEAATKKCYACGHMMPVADKFCPNCGRSTFGAPNPNRMNSAPAPTPKKNKALPIIIIAVILIIAAAAAVMFFLKGNAAAVLDEQLVIDINNFAIP